MIYKTEQYEMVEIVVVSEKEYENPFLDIDVWGEFIDPEGYKHWLLGFYNGNNCWCLRFTPWKTGVWEFNVVTEPEKDDLSLSGEIKVRETGKGKGFLRACPGQGWGFCYDSGEQALLIGDTMYNIFGVAYCGKDIQPVLKLRKKQGFNYIRARLDICNFEQWECRNQWQDREIWPWGGTSRAPEYDEFNLDYFRSVDKVLKIMGEMGIGVELIFETLHWEPPFNDRQNFLPEHEEMYLRYVVARYSAFKSVYTWCVANEYDLYLKGDTRLNEKYARRLAGIIKKTDPHGHPVGIHNNQMQPPLKERFAQSKEIDGLMLQAWGDQSTVRNKELTTDLDIAIHKHLENSGKVNILSEYGYEVNTEPRYLPDWHQGLLAGHTRRGAWRAMFMGVHVTCGFENTWGAVFTTDYDPEGASQIIWLKKFFTENICFYEFKPDRNVLNKKVSYERGERPLSMVNDNRDLIIVYLPVGGSCYLKLSEYLEAYWYDPMIGEELTAKGQWEDQDSIKFCSPHEGFIDKQDWVLVVKHS